MKASYIPHMGEKQENTVVPQREKQPRQQPTDGTHKKGVRKSRTSPDFTQPTTANFNHDSNEG
jgi:hypothetical protein